MKNIINQLFNLRQIQPSPVRVKKSLLILVTVVIWSLVIIGSAYAAGIVIRGGNCSVESFKNASGVNVDPSGYITGLSVNVVPDQNDKATYVNYLNGIVGYAHYGVAKLEQIKKAGGRITPDPLLNNPYHCLLSGDPKKLVSLFTRY
ncbi:MAG: hypothetical protein GY710_15130 [Desulfobacteraceae bacterium]|nr:hypothetical protein [Desulfobacteraceae bacterium]